MVKQIFHHYSKWEDIKNGILEKDFDELTTEKLTIKAKKLLCNPDEFYIIGLKVLSYWIYSCEQHLSNKSRNRQAWLGQACCCYQFKVPEHITKYAWRLMTKQEQDDANRIADILIKLWEDKNA